MKKLQNQYQVYGFGGFNVAAIVVSLGTFMTIVAIFSITVGFTALIITALGAIFLAALYDEEKPMLKRKQEEHRERKLAKRLMSAREYNLRKTKTTQTQGLKKHA